MPAHSSHQPRQYLGVMVSSTFKDLEQHRAALLDALRKEELFAIGMEDYVPVPGEDVIDSSLNMVRKGAAYIGLISHRCGQVLECPKRNPSSYSVTRLEFEEALKLGVPTLIFVMSQEHTVKPAHVDRDEKSIAKLNEFREAAKSGRIYIEFDSLEDFTPKAIHAVASLRRYIEDHSAPPIVIPLTTDSLSSRPKPPDFYAEPDYIASHQFVGRQAELDTLSDWSNRSDPTNLLLFEAIGGNGKSMLTWEWATKHSTKVRTDWAGRFWYSFYERGAIMQDFCQRALAYMTGRPQKDFETRKTGELKDELIAQLHSRPWLIILDGLERVLAAYHRIDAASIADDEVSSLSGQTLNRNPCDAVRDEDNDLIRALAACAPSKILISSRFTPRILLNSAGQAIAGVKRINLSGLRPSDAEALFRQCGITGDSAAIQDYLQQNCDNHPLVIGVLAGLIAYYHADRCNFDSWSIDPCGGAGLDLGKLNLTQRRNHILTFALDGVPSLGRQLLSTLAFFTDSIDYDTLKTLNPILPPQPPRIAPPPPLDKQPIWPLLAGEAKLKWKQNHDSLVRKSIESNRAFTAWQNSSDFIRASRHLDEAICDLEKRGLLQYNASERRHNLHPVVRGVMLNRLNVEEKGRFGGRVVDYFSSQPQPEYAKAKTLADLNAVMSTLRILLKLGRTGKALDIFRGDLCVALLTNLEAHFEVLSLLGAFFPDGWGILPTNMPPADSTWLANNAGCALLSCGEFESALAVMAAAISSEISRQDWGNACSNLKNAAIVLNDLNRISAAFRVCKLANELAVISDSNQNLFTVRLQMFEIQSNCGLWEESSLVWGALEQMGREWHRSAYRKGDAEYAFARSLFWQGKLDQKFISDAIHLAEQDNNRLAMRELRSLHGSWLLERKDFRNANDSYHEAVRMARERRLVDAVSETGLAITKHNLGILVGDDAWHEVERLGQLRVPAHRYLGMLWLSLGNLEQAKIHALAAYRWAWGDGAPYVRSYELIQTTALLNTLGVPIPSLPPYDPAKDEPFPWEADVRAAIEKLKADKEAKAKK